MVAHQAVGEILAGAISVAGDARRADAAVPQGLEQPRGEVQLGGGGPRRKPRSIMLPTVDTCPY